MKNKIMRCIIITFILLLPITFTQAQNVKPSWNIWVQELRQEAINDGINPITFDQAFNGLTPDTRIIHFDRKQPEHRLSFLQYRKTRIDPYRIKLGVISYEKHRHLLEKIGYEYGVSPCFITAFWGIESSYGRYMGNFSVIRSLATLAYDHRRSNFFRNELLIALHILNDRHIDQQYFKGEWAGASGQPQFLPSSWQKYAVDYDNNGKKDIWRNYADAFASIANYLKQNGWQSGMPWGIEVTLPNHFDTSLISSKTTMSVADWLRLGVHLAYGAVLPNTELQAYIIQPEGGPTFLVFKNFRVLLTYNNSNYYAASVGYLADQICKKTHTPLW